MGPKLYRVTIFFGSDVLRLVAEDYMLWWNSCARCLTRTWCSIQSSFWLRSTLFGLSPIKNYNFGWGPNFIELPSSLVQVFYKICNGRLHVFRMELLRKMPHQNSGLARVLSDSGQYCVDLSPVKRYNFGWGPTFVAYQSSLVETFQTRQSF